jgi:hypothetical protein
MVSVDPCVSRLDEMVLAEDLVTLRVTIGGLIRSLTVVDLSSWREGGLGCSREEGAYRSRTETIVEKENIGMISVGTVSIMSHNKKGKSYLPLWMVAQKEYREDVLHGSSLFLSKNYY